jgi:copper transport protein
MSVLLRGSRLAHVSQLRAMVMTVAISALAVLITPHSAWAHARLRKSDPTAGARLAAAPPWIRLWFTEVPEIAMTTVSLLDSTGARVPLGAPERDPEGQDGVRLGIQRALSPGVYTVRWRTAAADGHPSSGSLTFRVTAAASTPVPRVDTAAAGRDSEGTEATALTPAYVLTRAVSFATLLALIGAVVFRVAVLGRSRALDARVRDTLSVVTATRAAVVCGVFLVAALAKLHLQHRMMMGDVGLDVAHMRTMAMETRWGSVWLTQLGAGVIALMGFVIASRRRSVGWLIAGASCAVLSVTPALAGHAGASERLQTVSVLTDTLHVIGAAGWLGSLLWLVVVGLVMHPEAGEGRARVALLVRAFSPAALSFAALVTATGVVSAWLRLGSVPALWGTSYGQVLLLKLAVLAGVAGTGLYNWKRVQPALGTEGATDRLSHSATVELSIGLVVIIVTAVLVAMPTPLDVVK